MGDQKTIIKQIRVTPDESKEMEREAGLVDRTFSNFMRWVYHQWKSKKV